MQEDAQRRARERAEVAVAITVPGVIARARDYVELYGSAEHIC